MCETLGKIHSVQTLGAADGPGIRYTLFLQGCPLRCSYCHNPDTWDFDDYKYTKIPTEIFDDLKRYRPYFGKDGGITVTGGEALMQAKFVTELFKLCKENGINTCLDTSGCVLNDDVKKLLKHTDLVLLDIKFTNSQDYIKYVKGSYEKTLEFLGFLDNNSIRTWLRQVIIEGINDTENNILSLKAIRDKHRCVEKVELLPFRKLCVTKYQELGIPFPFESFPQTSRDAVENLNKFLENTEV